MQVHVCNGFKIELSPFDLFRALITFSTPVPKWVSYLKVAANVLAFIGAALLTRASMGVSFIPFTLFMITHIFWTIASLRSNDMAALSLNIALLPFDFMSVADRIHC